VKVADFNFSLPAELIAQTAAPRGTSRLLVLERNSGGITHGSVRDLPRFLTAGDLLVANDTRVFPARLFGHRIPSGGAVECLLLSRETVDLLPDQPAPGRRSAEVSAVARSARLEALRAKGERGSHASEDAHLAPRASHVEEIWSALMHPGQKLKPGARVRFEGDAGALIAEVLDRQFFGRRRIRLSLERGHDIDSVVDALGHIPLPPYIHRPDTADDRQRYQTVFAAHRGSVAAPTAGLHFDQALLAAIDAARIERASITLHVGYGTFKPVRVEEVEDHEVDPERYEISDPAAASINRALDERRRIFAVGTTTTRALEDAARRGTGRVPAGTAEARVFIYPGFDFRVISGLLTNFHLPQSSLLMLVSAFAGRERVLAAYREAIEQRYRFYSYGDAMLIV
jgi:S-adenosylmethionine:tRNA ribosyltransferase-isomerase